MKTLTKLMLVFMLITAFAACKKGGGDEESSTPITTEDLLNQYITIELNTAPSLRVLYFAKDGSDVKGTMDVADVRRIQTVKVNGNSFTYDRDGDGKKLYTFKMTKDADGKIKLTSYTYTNVDDAAVGIAYAQTDKVTDAPDFKGKKFKVDANNSYIRFPLDDWQLSNSPSFNGAPSSGYYVISPGAWKGNNDGAAYMGISVPKWKDGNEPVMLVQSNASADLKVYKSY